MNVVHTVGVDGARGAAGVVVVIDVLRAFTVSAYALAGGARECRLVATMAEARALARRTAGAVISAEVDTLPVPGASISNSPTQVAETDLQGKVMVQRTSAGTQAMLAVERAEAMYAASLVVAGPTAKACLLRRPAKVTLVSSGEFPEDHACARYIEALLLGETADLDRLLRPLLESDRYRKFAQGEWPGFPKTDLDLALAANRFDFALCATRREGFVRLAMERE